VTSYRGKCVGEGDEDAGGEERPHYGRHRNTRGSLPRVQHSGKSFRGYLSRERGLPRVLKIVHSGKPSPSAVLALGKDLTPSVSSAFFLRKHLPRVQHSVKNFFFFYKNPLPRVLHSGKEFDFFKKNLFPECPIPSTRGRVVPLPRHSGKVFPFFLTALPRVPLPRHSGKVFFFFLCELIIYIYIYVFFFSVRITNYIYTDNKIFAMQHTLFNTTIINMKSNP
jgi:hypothetical protein